MSIKDDTWASWRPNLPETQLFVQQCFQSNNKAPLKVRITIILMGIHWWPDSIHKEPAMRISFSCYDVINIMQKVISIV